MEPGSRKHDEPDSTENDQDVDDEIEETSEPTTIVRMINMITISIRRFWAVSPGRVFLLLIRSVLSAVLDQGD